MSSASGYAARLIGTLIVWGLFTTIMGFVTLGNGVRSGDMLWVITILALMAGYSTRVIWRGGEGASATASSQLAGKAKRDAKDRLAKTLNALDEDEAAAMLEDLKARLQGGDSDGEVSAVEMLRAERHQRN